MEQHPAPEEDPGADTEMFRAFAQGDEPAPPRAKMVGAPFRIFTLLIGLVVFVAIVLLLLR